MPSYAAIAPIAQHRGREPQLTGDLHQWPTAACQQGDCLRLELIRKMTPFLAHSTPSRSPRSLAKVSTNSGEAHIYMLRGSRQSGDGKTGSLITGCASHGGDWPAGRHAKQEVSAMSGK